MTPQQGVLVTTSAVLLRRRRALASATLRIVGASGHVWLLMTATVFALAWPVFTRMRNDRNWYRHVEDPYLHVRTGLELVTLGALPLFLLLLGAGSAALQRACSRAVTAEADAAAEEDGPGRLRSVMAVYTLRFLIVWPLPLAAALVVNAFTGYHLDTEEQYLPYDSWARTLVEASPVVFVFVAVLLRLALALAPAAAADGQGPFAALGRSWSLAWTRAGGVRLLALALPLAALTAGVLRLTVQLALPLRPLLRGILEQATGNFFAAYYAGILAPVIVGILVTAALTLPLTCTAFAVLHQRLRPAETSRA